jgi:hypothetical protein
VAGAERSQAQISQSDSRRGNAIGFVKTSRDAPVEAVSTTLFVSLPTSSCARYPESAACFTGLPLVVVSSWAPGISPSGLLPFFPGIRGGGRDFPSVPGELR